MSKQNVRRSIKLATIIDIQKAGRFYRREQNVFQLDNKIGRFYRPTKSANFIDRLS